MRRDILDRVAVFDDSDELSEALVMLADDHKEIAYWLKESATHIDGLYCLACELSKEIKRLRKEVAQ